MYERAEGEIGNKYGRLTVLEVDYEKTDLNNSDGKHYGAFVKCRCECGTIKTYGLRVLRSNHTYSCGCSRFNNPLNVDDLTGQKFGRLTVIGRDVERDKSEGKGIVHWLCKCDCGNEKLSSVTGFQLKSGHTQSCGCYASEQIAMRNKKYSTKQNEVKQPKDEMYLILIDEDGNECCIDKEDYEIIKRWYWRKIPKRNDIKRGYWTTNSKIDDKYNKSTLMLHQIIAELKYGEYDSSKLMPDHLSRDTDDNRKCNITLKNSKDNSHNRGLSKVNTSGKTGVSFNKEKGMWTAYITYNYKTIFLGDYENIEEAISARKEAEIKYGFTCDDITAPYDYKEEVI